MSATFVTPHAAVSVRLPARFTSPTPTPAVYRRRRLGAALFVMVALVSFGSLAQRGLADRGGEPASVSAIGRTTYVVQPGDTLWAVAERLYPSDDLSLVVDAMVTLNGGSGLQAGQLLQLP